MKALSLTVTGRVQGVYFRVSAQKKAQELEVKGWCKNQADGSVLIHVEGHEVQLTDFVSWCYQGPVMALVRDVSRVGYS